VPSDAAALETHVPPAFAAATERLVLLPGADGAPVIPRSVFAGAIGFLVGLSHDDPGSGEARSRRGRGPPAIRADYLADHRDPVRAAPVWFLWRDGEFLIYGAKNGPKNESLKANPHVSLHLEGNGRGGANVIFEGDARIDPDGPWADAVPEYIDKYRGFIDGYGWTPQSFAGDYPHVIRVAPTRARIW
jgi:PPOX class probable F420-dependent enzyme